MGALFQFIVGIVIVFLVIVNKTQKSNKGNNQKISTSTSKHEQNIDMAQYTTPRPTTQNRNTVSALRASEDRKNDWLAKELAEERQAALRVKMMFGIKDSANAIRSQHHNNCNAENAKADLHS